MRVALVYPGFGTDHHSPYFTFGPVSAAFSLLEAVDTEGDRLSRSQYFKEAEHA